jgi:hypothetical protein
MHLLSILLWFYWYFLAKYNALMNDNVLVIENDTICGIDYLQQQTSRYIYRATQADTKEGRSTIQQYTQITGTKQHTGPRCQ